VTRTNRLLKKQCAVGERPEKRLTAVDPGATRYARFSFAPVLCADLREVTPGGLEAPSGYNLPPRRIGVVHAGSGASALWRAAGRRLHSRRA
jgi:hypothetical protein